MKARTTFISIGFLVFLFHKISVICASNSENDLFYNLIKSTPISDSLLLNLFGKYCMRYQYLNDWGSIKCSNSWGEKRHYTCHFPSYCMNSPTCLVMTDNLSSPNKDFRYRRRRLVGVWSNGFDWSDGTLSCQCSQSLIYRWYSGLIRRRSTTDPPPIPSEFMSLWKQ